VSRREEWSERAGAFASEKADADQRRPLKRLVELCALAPGARTLDVATGAGFTAFAFAQAGCDVVALDPAHGMLLQVHGGWTDRGLPGRAKTVESWAEALPFAPATFDAVVSHRAPHEFRDRDAFAAEARRILKTRGILGIADQAPVDGWEVWHNDLERLRDPGHERSLSLREWTELLERAGFSVRHAELVDQPRDVEDWIARVRTPEPAATKVRELCEFPPDELHAVYRPQRDAGGRLWYQSQHAVVVATA
jgi:SAM-dependent methyltransferase